MGAYILRRLLLIIPTLLGIMLVNFALAQFVPGGPVDQAIAAAQGQGDVFGGFAGENNDAGLDINEGNEQYVGARGLPPEFIEQLEKEFGFDKPPVQRFLNMMWDYMRFDFGDSYFQSQPVVDLVLDKLPVSIFARRSRMAAHSTPGPAVSSSQPMQSPVFCSASCYWCYLQGAAITRFSRCGA